MELQERFELENPAKARNMGSYGSGGRTWAAWLRMWGMWYDDSNVTLTSAADVVLCGDDAYEQMERQIMNFQITSAYSEHQKLDQDFKVFPFRLMIRFMLDERLGYLLEDEVALFLLQMKDEKSYENAVAQMLKYRGMKLKDDTRLINRYEIIKNHMRMFSNYHQNDSPEKIKKYARYLKDIANTFLVNIRLLHEVEYDQHNGSIRIKSESKSSVKKNLKKHEKEYKFSNLYKKSEKAFMERYGLRIGRSKASRKKTKPKTMRGKRLKSIEYAISQIKGANVSVSDDDLIKLIIRDTMYSESEVRQTFLDNPKLWPAREQALHKEFLENYYKYAESGVEGSKFESFTRQLFQEMGFETEKHRKQGFAGNPEIDGLILNQDIQKSGLLECKSGAKYTFPIGDIEKMKYTYLKKYTKEKIGGKTYELDFFVYVIGKNCSGLDNFKSIIEETNIPGTVIYARELTAIYDKLVKEKISKKDVWGVFQKNRMISRTDI